MFNTLVYQVNI